MNQDHTEKLNLQKRLRTVFNRIQESYLKCKRKKKPVKIVAVTKNIELNTIKLALKTGISIVGENYVQEAKEKHKAISLKNIAWHLIGHLQSNKSKQAVEIFDFIHSVDSMNLAKTINKHAKIKGKVQKILLQVNTYPSLEKLGFTEINLMNSIENIGQLSNISVVGLMTMLSKNNTSESARNHFSRLATLSDKIDAFNFPRIKMKELSMGTSKDFPVAIEEGATLVRIGTSIFGERS